MEEQNKILVRIADALELIAEAMAKEEPTPIENTGVQFDERQFPNGVPENLKHLTERLK